ncbi:hypothetical protein MMC32_007614 [Xylographa parallela]|nr:hypothetical protein [Xylographa parallela]
MRYTDRVVATELYSDGHPQPFRNDHVKTEVARRQGVFLSTISKHKEYAPWVWRLTWTLLFGPVDDSEGAGVQNACDLEWDGPLQFPETATWDILETLVNVRYLDFASLHYRMTKPEVRKCPPVLFPKATSVRLLGWMNHELATAVVSSNSKQLKHLAIDDVQHWGQHPDGEPWACHDQAIPEHIGEEAFIPPGVMSGLLDPLCNLCPRLTSLFLRKAGQANGTHMWGREGLDEMIYKEWARFLGTVKDTLQYLTFEQGVGDPVPGYSSWVRPMDSRFLEHILPVLSSGGWDPLKRLELRGLGAWEATEAMDRLFRGPLTRAFETGKVELILKPKAEKPCPWFDGYC